MCQHQHGPSCVVALAAIILQRDRDEPTTDVRTEQREPAPDERDTERVAPDPRVRVSVVAANRDRCRRDTRCLGGEESLRPRALVGGKPVPRLAAIDPSRDDEQRCGGESDRRGRKTSKATTHRPPRRRYVDEPIPLFDDLAPAEVCIVAGRSPSAGELLSARSRQAFASLPPAAAEKLELGNQQDREREPERDHVL